MGTRLVVIAACVVIVLGGCTVASVPAPDTTTAEPYASEEPGVDAVTPVVVVAGPDLDGVSVSATGYVRGIVESGGECTFRFADETGTSVEAGTVSESDSTTTSCGLVSVPRSSLVKGTWTVTLSYVSTAGEVSTSAGLTTEVP